jgi:hypothetical protein
VLSDHGSGIGFDVHDTLHSDLEERTSNLLAVRAPGRPDVLPAGTTPVNVLPRLFNAYFGTQLPLQPDTTWAWRGDSVLDLVEIRKDPTTGSWQPRPSGAARIGNGSS